MYTIRAYNDITYLRRCARIILSIITWPTWSVNNILYLSLRVYEKYTDTGPNYLCLLKY